MICLKDLLDKKDIFFWIHFGTWVDMLNNNEAYLTWLLNQDMVYVVSPEYLLWKYGEISVGLL